MKAKPTSSELLREWELHHFGYACFKIKDQRKYFKLLGFEEEGPIFKDRKQLIRGQFILASGIRIELFEKLSKFATLNSWLKRSGPCVYHLS